jgi:selenoprotein W-related protein
LADKQTHNTKFSQKMKPRITIEYCPKCGWMLRAAYMAQELLTTFSDELKSVTLMPSEIAGRFVIYKNDKLIFDRKEHGGFGEIKELKQIIRDIISPNQDLEHSDIEGLSYLSAEEN